jgi:hypothetical protein
MGIERTNENEETRRNGETEIVQQHTGVEYAAFLVPTRALSQCPAAVIITL